jgi:hypothetical protein
MALAWCRRSVAAVLLSALCIGAAENKSQCSAPPPGGESHKDSSGGRACKYTPHRLVVHNKKVWGRVDVICSEPILYQNLTIFLEKRGSSGDWDQVERGEYDRSPGIGYLKVSRLSTPCKAGYYRMKWHATTQASKEPDGEADRGGGTIGPMVVNKELCA